MIQLSKNYSLPEREQEITPVKVVGIGGAGSNALDRIVLDGLERADVVTINTDVQSLASSMANHKVQLGRTTTHGLGAGGDPEVGCQAAMESADEIREALTGARMVFICAGLGGGTGSGAAPVVAQIARETGSLAVVFATLPFSFEGKRRGAQAREALARLNEITNAVICFENDRMGDIVAPRAGIHQAFAMADMMISQSVRAVVNLIQRPGIIRIGFDDLLAALRGSNGRCLFGFGESDSDNRAHDALTQALKTPLMDKGRMLADAARVLVQVAGGPGMTLSEVEILMKELGRHVSDQTQILFGTAVDGRMGNRLSVTIISSLGADAMENASAARPQTPLLASTTASPPASNTLSQPSPPEIEVASPGGAESDPEPELAPVETIPPVDLIPFEPPAPLESITPEPPLTLSKPPVIVATEVHVSQPDKPRLILPKKKPAPIKETTPAPEKIQAKQEVLQFEPVTRGRFEKSEPTIIEGQDLDVPTFLRKNIRVK